MQVFVVDAHTIKMFYCCFLMETGAGPPWESSMTATATYAMRITLAITAALIPAYVALPPKY